MKSHNFELSTIDLNGNIKKNDTNRIERIKQRLLSTDISSFKKKNENPSRFMSLTLTNRTGSAFSKVKRIGPKVDKVKKEIYGYILKVKKGKSASQFEMENLRSDSANTYNRALNQTKERLKSATERKILHKNMLKETVKGKLLNLISKSLVADKETIEAYRKNFYLQENDININEKHLDDHMREYRYRNSIGILTRTNPDLLTRHWYVSRFNDCYITPDELINKNFDEKELNILRSDPNYFKLNKGPFKNTLIMKFTTLTDILKEEDNKNNKNITKMTKNHKIKSESLKNHVIHTKGINRINQETDCLKRDHPSPLESSRPEVKFIPAPKRRNEYVNKINLFTERKNKIEMQTVQKFKNIQSNLKAVRDRLEYNRKKQEEELYITNTYVSKIKNIYENKS